LKPLLYVLLAALLLIALVGVPEARLQSQAQAQPEAQPRASVATQPKTQPAPRPQAQTQDIIAAARSGDLAEVKELIEADPTLVNARDKNERTPLHYACREAYSEMVLYLLDKGADVNARDVNGVTPLHWAAMVGDAALVKLLLDREAEPSPRNAEGNTPLNLAAIGAFREITDLLLDRGAELDTAGGKGVILLQMAAGDGSAKLFRAVMNQEGQKLFTSEEANYWTMQDAVCGGSVQIVDALLAKEVPLFKQKDIYGWTLIHYAASKGRMAMIQHLADKGIDINARTNAGETAFNLAQAAGDQSTQEVIIRLGGRTGRPIFPLLGRYYMGQTPPGLTPEIFMPGIVSRPDMKEMSITFAPGGKEFCFYRILGPDNSKLFDCRVAGGAWTAPEEVMFSPAYSASLPMFSLDGKRLFFVWENSASEAAPAIWVTQRMAAGWSDPKFVGQGMFLSQTRNGQIYTTDMSSLNTEGRTYIAKVILNNDRFTKYERLAVPSPSGSAAHPCIAPDGSYVIFDEAGGDHLLLSFKKKDGTWGEPIDLTRHGFEPLAGVPSVSPDGKYLFFKQGCRGALDLAHSNTNRDIWWVSIKVIESLRPKEAK